MRILIPLFFGLLLFSCGASKKITECGSKAPKLKTIQALPDLEPTNHNIFPIEVVYYVLFDVKDTATVDLQILETHKKLNELYGSAFKFMMYPSVIYSPFRISIDDAMNKRKLLRSNLENIREFDDVLSVYLVEDGNSTLLGFTVVFPDAKEYYIKLSPKYDNLIVSRSGLANINTVPHEVGHVFGLVHPHDIKKQSIFEMFGMGSKRAQCINIMSYSCCAGEVTNEQIGFMWNYCGMNRHNLIMIDTMAMPKYIP